MEVKWDDLSERGFLGLLSPAPGSRPAKPSLGQVIPSGGLPAQPIPPERISLFSLKSVSACIQRLAVGRRVSWAPLPPGAVRDSSSTPIPTASRAAASASPKPSSMCSQHTCGGFVTASLHPGRIRNLATKRFSHSPPRKSPCETLARTGHPIGGPPCPANTSGKDFVVLLEEWVCMHSAVGGWTSGFLGSAVALRNPRSDRSSHREPPCPANTAKGFRCSPRRVGLRAFSAWRLRVGFLGLLSRPAKPSLGQVIPSGAPLPSQYPRKGFRCSPYRQGPRLLRHGPCLYRKDLYRNFPLCFLYVVSALTVM